MGLAKSLVNGVKQRFLAKYGEKIVSNLGDTSADAPNKFSAPKRQLYEELEAQRDGAPPEKLDR